MGYVGAGFLFREPSGRYLFVLRSQNPRRWEIPGGHAEKGEIPYETAKREALEEIAILPPHAVRWVDTSKNGRERAYWAFQADVSGCFTPRLSDEHVDHRWMTIPEALADPIPVHPKLRKTLLEVQSAVPAGGVVPAGKMSLVLPPRNLDVFVGIIKKKVLNVKKLLSSLTLFNLHFNKEFTGSDGYEVNPLEDFELDDGSDYGAGNWSDDIPYLLSRFNGYDLDREIEGMNGLLEGVKSWETPQDRLKATTYLSKDVERLAEKFDPSKISYLNDLLQVNWEKSVDSYEREAEDFRTLGVSHPTRKDFEPVISFFRSIKGLSGELYEAAERIAEISTQAYGAYYDRTGYIPEVEKVEKLYHASVNAREIGRTGFLTEIPDALGIGGAQGDKAGRPAISFTSDLWVAFNVARALKEVILISKGEIQLAEIQDWAKREGVLDKVLDTYHAVMGKEIDPGNSYHVFSFYRYYLTWSPRRYDPVFYGVTNRLLKQWSSLNIKDVGVVVAEVDMTNPDITYLQSMQEYRVPPQAVISVKNLDRSIPAAKMSAALPETITAYHCGRKLKSGVFSLDFLGTGERFSSPPLGPGIYFSTEKGVAELYCKYVEDSYLYEVQIPTKKLLSPRIADDRWARVRAVPELADWPKVANPKRAAKALVGLGIPGVWSEISSETGLVEIAVYDPSIIRIVNSIPAGKMSAIPSGTLGVRKRFWHGTSSKYLRSILKKGLLPDLEEKQYSGDRGAYISIETFGGIYVTDNFGTASQHAGNAARKTEGTPLFVGMTLETRSPYALSDEDDVLPTISAAVRTDTAYDLTGGPSFWGGVFRYNNLYDWGGLKPEFHKLSEAIQKADLTKPIDLFFETMIRSFPRLGKRYERQKQKLDLLLAEAVRAHARYLLSLYHKEYAPREIKKLEEYMKSDRSTQDSKNLYKEKIKLWRTLPPEVKQGSFQRMAKAITNLSESIREILDPIEDQFRHNARFMNPITYRGKNRIQLVVETIRRQSAKIAGHSTTGRPYFSTYTDVIFHYLQAPEFMDDFLSTYAKRTGGDYRVIVAGSVVRHELGNDSKWPEDLWGPQVPAGKMSARDLRDILPKDVLDGEEEFDDEEGEEGVLVKNIPMGALSMPQFQGEATLTDIRRGELSMTEGLPVLFYNTEKEQLIVDDGNHRIFQRWLKGEEKFDAYVYSGSYSSHLREVYPGEEKFDWSEDYRPIPAGKMSAGWVLMRKFLPRISSPLFHATTGPRASQILKSGFMADSHSNFGPSQMGVSTTRNLSFAMKGDFGNHILVLDGNQIRQKWQVRPYRDGSVADEYEERVVAKVIPPSFIRGYIANTRMPGYEVKWFAEQKMPFPIVYRTKKGWAVIPAGGVPAGKMSAVRLFHTTSWDNASKILETGQIASQSPFVSLSEQPLFLGDIRHKDVVVVLDADRLKSQLAKVEYTEAWAQANPEQTTYIAGEGWYEQFQYPENCLDEDGFEDQECMEAAYHEAEIESFLWKKNEREWITTREGQPLAVQGAVTGLLVLDAPKKEYAESILKGLGRDLPVSVLPDGKMSARRDLRDVRISRGTITIGDGKPIPIKKIGQGMFAKAYATTKGKPRVFLEIADDAGDYSKEMLSSITNDTRSKYLPKTTKIGVTPTSTIYEQPLYKAPLRKADSLKAWKEYRTLEKCWQEALRTIQRRQGGRWDSWGHDLQHLVRECAKSKKLSPSLIRALELLTDESSLYGESYSFEFSPRNLATDTKGNLILLDVLYDIKSVQKRSAAGRMRAGRSCPLRSQLYGGIPGGGGYTNTSEYEIGARDIAEAAHCILGSLGRAMLQEGESPEGVVHRWRIETGHFQEEMGIIEKSMKEYRRPIYLNQLNDLRGRSRDFGEPQAQEWRKRSIDSIREASPLLRDTAKEMLGKLDGVEMEGYARTAAIHAYMVLISLAEAMLRSVKTKKLGPSAFDNPKLIENVSLLRKAISELPSSPQRLEQERQQKEQAQVDELFALLQ